MTTLGMKRSQKMDEANQKAGGQRSSQSLFPELFPTSESKLDLRHCEVCEGHRPQCVVESP